MKAWLPLKFIIRIWMVSGTHFLQMDLYPCWCWKIVLKVVTAYWSSHWILHFTNSNYRNNQEASLSCVLLFEMVTWALWRGWNKERTDGEGPYCTAVHHQSVSNGGHTDVKKRIWHTRTKFDDTSNHACSRQMMVLLFCCSCAPLFHAKSSKTICISL